MDLLRRRGTAFYGCSDMKMGDIYTDVHCCWRLALGTVELNGSELHASIELPQQPQEQPERWKASTWSDRCEWAWSGMYVGDRNYGCDCPADIVIGAQPETYVLHESINEAQLAARVRDNAFCRHRYVNQDGKDYAELCYKVTTGMCRQWYPRNVETMHQDDVAEFYAAIKRSYDAVRQYFKSKLTWQLDV